MKYYQVSLSAEPEIIGVNNGIYQVEIDKKTIEDTEGYREFTAFFNYNNSVFWNNQNKIKELKPPTIRGKMLKKAKLTDVMGYAPEYSFLSNVYSDKFINILKGFNIMNYTKFDFEVKDINQKYYLLHIESIKSDKINFEKSQVITGHKSLGNVKYHTVNRQHNLDIID